MSGLEAGMERIADKVVRAFEGRGYEFLERAGERVTFRRGEEELSVHFMRAHLTLERLPEPAPGEKHIIVVLAGADLQALAEVESRQGVEVWDRDRFKSEVGEAIAEEALGRIQPLLLEEEATQAAETNSERVVEGVAEAVVSREQAERLAARVAPYRSELLLVPWYLMQVEVRGREKRNVALAVNALSGHVDLWTRWVTVRKDAPWPHTLKEPRIDSRRAFELATAALRTILESSESRQSKGKMVVVRKDFGSVGPENVRIVSTSLFHIPHWRVEGTRGLAVINAATGTVIEESYFEDETR